MSHEEERTHPVTILELAEYRLGREARTAGDFEEAGLQILGGCERCHATIAAYNACPSKTGNWRCLNECIEDLGWDTVEEANWALFGLEGQTVETLKTALQHITKAQKVLYDPDGMGRILVAGREDLEAASHLIGKALFWMRPWTKRG